MRIGVHYPRDELLKYLEFESIPGNTTRKLILEFLTGTKNFQNSNMKQPQLCSDSKQYKEIQDWVRLAAQILIFA